MTDSSSAERSALPGFALALGLLWLAAGALYKLFDGVPADLPSSVVEKSPFDAWDTFRYSIAVELAVVGLVIAVPRLGWLLLCGAFATFLAILAPLAMEGAESCGCFGGTVTIKPTTMMAIDGGLLLLILFSRPWRMKGAGLGFAAALPLVAAGVYGPIAKLPRPADVAGKGPRIQAPAVTPEDAGPGDTSAAHAGTGAPTGAEGPGAQGAGEATTPPVDGGAEVTNPDTVEQPPAAGGLPSFMQLDFPAMDGQALYDQAFYAIADMSEGFLDVNSHVVVYRRTCEVCEEHLKALWADEQRGEPSWGDRTLVLMRIAESVDTPENNLCTVLPGGAQKVTLPELERGYLVTTPVAFDVDDTGVIRNVVDVRKELGH